MRSAGAFDVVGSTASRAGALLAFSRQAGDPEEIGRRVGLGLEMAGVMKYRSACAHRLVLQPQRLVHQRQHGVQTNQVEDPANEAARADDLQVEVISA